MDDIVELAVLQGGATGRVTRSFSRHFLAVLVLGVAVSMLVGCTRVVVYGPTPAATTPALSSPAATSTAIVSGAAHTCSLPESVATAVLRTGPNPQVELTSDAGRAKGDGFAECYWVSPVMMPGAATSVIVDYGPVASSSIRSAAGLGKAEASLCKDDKIYTGIIPNSFVCGSVGIPPMNPGSYYADYSAVMVTNDRICYISYYYAGARAFDEAAAVAILKGLQAGYLPYVDV